MAGNLKRNSAAIDQIIGSNIRGLRIQRGLSQSELGISVNVTFQQIQKYEKGTNRVAASALFNIAKMLGVPVQTFFEGVDADENSAHTPHRSLSVTSLKAAAALDENSNPGFKVAIFNLIKAVNAE